MHRDLDEWAEAVSEITSGFARALALFVRSFQGAARHEKKEVELLTAAEVAERLRISRKTVYRDAKSGRLPSVRFGRRVLFDAAAVDKYRDGALQGGDGPPPSGPGPPSDI